MDASPVSTATIAGGAFVLATLFGFIASRTNFCTLGAVSDALNMGDWNRMRMWGLAVGVAVLGTAALQAAGFIDTANAFYTGPRLIWLSNLVGGLCFGVGMTLASGCGSKTLIRIGGGNLKSVVVFVFLAISAYATLRGLFGVWRVAFLDPVAIELGAGQALPHLLAAALGVSAHSAGLLCAGVVGGALLVFAVSSPEFRQRDFVLGGTAIGLLVVAGWYLTGHVGYVAEHPDTLQAAFIGTQSGRMESFTFVAPIAYTLELLMFWSDSSRFVSFGIASVLGVVCGSALDSLASRSFRIEGFHSPADLVRHIVGAILMGFGGVTAMGCTIGQGVSGLSTLALGAFIATAAIVAGAVMAMKVQYWLMMRDP